jgi:hypothetical protein
MRDRDSQTSSHYIMGLIIDPLPCSYCQGNRNGYTITTDGYTGA